jgi:hypothetical protein
MFVRGLVRLIFLLSLILFWVAMLV